MRIRIEATHTDIGLHNSQYVQRAGTVSRLEQAMRLVGVTIE